LKHQKFIKSHKPRQENYQGGQRRRYSETTVASKSKNTKLQVQQTKTKATHKGQQQEAQKFRNNKNTPSEACWRHKHSSTKALEQDTNTTSQLHNTKTPDSRVAKQQHQQPLLRHNCGKN
jgi:hypothetical protein